MPDNMSQEILSSPVKNEVYEDDFQFSEGSDLDSETEGKYTDIIDEGGIYDLEDYHGFYIDENTYEMYGNLDIVKIN